MPTNAEHTHTDHTESIRRAYEAFTEDPERMWDFLDDDVVFHIAGDHPLSGDYVGRDEVRRYFRLVREATGGRGGYTATEAFEGESGDVVLVEVTAYHGEGPFIRNVIHRLRLRDDRVVEFWDSPYDQGAEDRFWRARVPAQRRPGHLPGVAPQQRSTPTPG